MGIGEVEDGFEVWGINKELCSFHLQESRNGCELCGRQSGRTREVAHGAFVVLLR